MGALTHLRPAWIFDVDGTLADVSTIRYLVEGSEKNFAEFHSRSVDMPPHDHVVALAKQAHADGYAVLVVTARTQTYRPHTAMWLALHDIPSDAMYMRAAGDHRPDYEVKKDILARIRTCYHVVHAVDDNPSVLALWEEENIPTTRIPGWGE